MRSHEALLYLPFTGKDPLQREKCPVCETVYILAHGFAYPAWFQHVNEPEKSGLRMGFFCSEVCLLNFIPTEFMYSA